LKKDTVFFRQAELLLRVLPFVNEEEIFALKGGTDISKPRSNRGLQGILGLAAFVSGFLARE
jgi:hypothetical protein